MATAHKPVSLIQKPIRSEVKGNEVLDQGISRVPPRKKDSDVGVQMSAS